MTTMRTIITDAIVMTRARALGDDPAAEETAAALKSAQAMYLTFPIVSLTDVLITDDYTAKENERITFVSGSPTVTYPTTISDCRGDRAPDDGAIVEVAGTSGSTRKIYIAELKTWMTLTGLTLDSEQPFGPTHDLSVTAMIATRICGPVLHANLPDDVSELARQGRQYIRAAFRQHYEPTFDRALLGPWRFRYRWGR